MSGISSRRTYDTDSITLRRVYAYDISNNTPFSTGYVLTSLKKGVASFESPYVSLSTIGYLGLPAQISSINGVLQSTSEFLSLLYPSSPTLAIVSSITGLASAGYISTSQIQSTIEGLGTFGYISTFAVTAVFVSTVQGLGSLGYVSTSGLLSTVEGLGSASYVSSSQLTPIFVSSITGLGSANYISSSQLFSTVSGLSQIGYISSSQLQSSISRSLQSTVQGLGTSGYVSSGIFRSSYKNIGSIPPNYENIAYLQSNLTVGNTIGTLSFDIGNALRSKINPGVSKLDIEVEPNLQFAYYDPTSRAYEFRTTLLRNSTFVASNTLAFNSYTYYILNSSPINLPFFFQQKYRFVLTDSNVLSLLTNNSIPVISLYHSFGSVVPATNQFYACPTSSICVNVVLDNTPRS
jgi:hypothetical protein